MVLKLNKIEEKEQRQQEEKVVLSDDTLTKDLDTEFDLDSIPYADSELPENYLRSNLLFVPERAKEIYRERGYDLQWVRIIDPETKRHDTGHIQKKEQQGYKFVKRNEVPGLENDVLSIFGDVMTDHRGLYIVNDCALARIPLKFVEARRKAKEAKTKNRFESVKSDLRKNSLSPDIKHGEKFEVTRSQPNDSQELRDVSFGE